MPKSEMSSSQVQQEEEQPEEEEPEEKKKKKKPKKKKPKKKEEEEEPDVEEEPKSKNKKTKSKKEVVEEEGNEEQGEDEEPKKSSVNKKKKKKNKNKKDKSELESLRDPSEKNGQSSAKRGKSSVKKEKSSAKKGKPQVVRKGPSSGPSTKSKAPASVPSGNSKEGKKKASKVVGRGLGQGRPSCQGKASSREGTAVRRVGSRASSNALHTKKKGNKSMQGPEGKGKAVDTSAYDTRDVNIIQVNRFLNPPKEVEEKIEKKESGLDINRTERIVVKPVAASNLQIDELAPRLKPKPSSLQNKREKEDTTLAHTQNIPMAPPMDYPAFLKSHYNRAGPGPKKGFYTLEMMYRVMADASEVLKDEPALVDVEPPVTIVGDIHGQFNDLIAMFSVMGPPPGRKYVFLGDFVDRGKMSCEVIMLLLAYKAYYPRSIVLLRGNHECARINSRYGFLKELELKLKDKHTHVWALFQKVFDLLPVAGLIGTRILCMHGGISPSLTDFDALRSLQKPIRNPSRGVVNDLLWADPEASISGWRKSKRGSGFLFGSEALQEFIVRMNIDLVVRAHQVCLDGFYITRDFRLVTLFSAPMYCGLLRNAGAVMNVSENLHVSFSVFVPESKGVFRRITQGNKVWDEDVDYIKNPK